MYATISAYRQIISQELSANRSSQEHLELSLRKNSSYDKKNIQSAYLSAADRRGHKVMQHRERERGKKRKQDERQEAATESED